MTKTKKIKVVNNRNTSPKKNIDNEQLEKGLIVDNDKLENIELKILTDYLEQMGIIKGFIFDRIDKNTETEHSHFYFDSEINNNTLEAIFINYIENGEIDINKIQKLSGEINKMKKINFLGILDNSEQIGDFENKNQLTKILGQNDKGSIIEKDINSNLGINKNTIIKTFDYIIKLDNNEILDLNKLENAFLDSFVYFKKDMNSLNLQITQKDNIINVKFDNNFQDLHTQEKYGLTKAIVKIRLEEMLKNLQESLKNDKIDLANIGDFSKKVTTNKTVFDDLENTKVKSSVLNAQNSPLTAQIQNNSTNAPLTPNNAQNSVKISFINEIENLNITDLQNKKVELEEVVKKLEDVNNILKNPDIEKQINETKEQVKAIENQNFKLEEINKIIEEKEHLEGKVKYTENELIKLNDEFTKVSKELEVKENQNKILIDEVKTKEEDIKDLKEKNIKLDDDLVLVRKSLEQSIQFNNEKNQEIQELGNKNFELTNENRELKSSLNHYKGNFEQLQESSKKIEELNNRLTTVNEVLNEDLKQKDDEITSLKAQNEALNELLKVTKQEKNINSDDEMFNTFVKPQEVKTEVKTEDKKEVVSIRDEIYLKNGKKALEYMSNLDISEDKKIALEELLKAKDGDLLEFGKSIKIHKNDDKSISNIEILDKNFENKTLEEKENKNRNRE